MAETWLSFMEARQEIANQVLSGVHTIGVLLFVFAVNAMAEEGWEPVTGADQLRQIMSNTNMVSELRGDARSTARYNADGTGVVQAWGESFDRAWELRGDDQVCITAGQEQSCRRIEKSLTMEGTFRAINSSTGETVVFTVSRDGEPVLLEPANTVEGGVAKPSAEEVAKSLANPNTPLASLTLKIQQRYFTGDLPDADGQSSTTFLFQPSFPFKLENGASIFFRPAIPIIVDQPIYDGVEADFNSVSGMGDIGFDLAYGRTTDTGILWAVGIITTLPTATKKELGPDRWNLGPEFIIGKLSKKYVVGALTSYQTDIGGSGDADISLTTVNAFFTYLPGGGWNVGSAPIMNYDHEQSQWTLPINITLGKTLIVGGRPWKLSMEVNYFIEQADAFGPEWMIGFNIAPVVENFLARMLQ